MTKLRGLGLTLLIVGVLCALVPILGLAGPAEVEVQGRPTAAQPSPLAVHEQQQQQPAQVDPETRIDPEESERANSERNKNKLIVGAVTVVLLGLVVWGRRFRSQRRNKASS